MKTNESRTDAVHVLINNHPVWLDLENLKDSELAMRDEKGNYETESGEQHFTHQNAIKAAEKQGKRLLTNKEHKFIESLPRSWDNDKKGFWFTFNRVEGGYVEVFFPAAGYRYSSSGSIGIEGSDGYYWSASPYSSGSGNVYYMKFNSGLIFPSNIADSAYGFSVRCVKD